MLHMGVCITYGRVVKADPFRVHLLVQVSCLQPDTDHAGCLNSGNNLFSKTHAGKSLAKTEHNMYLNSTIYSS